MTQKQKFQSFSNNKASAILLNLLLPGAGHLFHKEYVFGVFVMLIWLIASGLFYLSFLIELNIWGRIVLFSLPIIFYFFTFFDLINSIKKKRNPQPRLFSFALTLYLVSIVYQIFSPTAPLNFAIANGPIPFVLNDNRLAPVYTKGTLMKASRLAYTTKIVGYDKPVFHHLPERYDIVRFQTASGHIDNAVVIGLPEEVIELSEGTLIINGYPDFEGWIGGVTFTGNISPATVDTDKLLAATLKLGAIDKVFQVPFSQIIGKVGPVL